MHIDIRRANEDDSRIIADIGRVAVEESHKDSCPQKDTDEFLAKHYNEDAIKEELRLATNIYHLISCDGMPAGFSKMILNEEHPNIRLHNTTKLDRIYLLKEFYDQKLGFALMNYNIQLSKETGQTGMWLFTWNENHRAVNFYKKVGFVVVGSHRFKVSETHYNAHHQMLLTY